jgi:hypothetical protein
MVSAKVKLEANIGERFPWSFKISRILNVADKLEAAEAVEITGR